MSTVYVKYTVQPSDTLLRLWKISHMTRKEWIEVNDGRNPGKPIYAGEQIVIKDPIETCRISSDYRLIWETIREFTGGRNLDICEDRTEFQSFKPLSAYIESIKNGK